MPVDVPPKSPPVAGVVDPKLGVPNDPAAGVLLPKSPKQVWNRKWELKFMLLYSKYIYIRLCHENLINKHATHKVHLIT